MTALYTAVLLAALGLGLVGRRWRLRRHADAARERDAYRTTIGYLQQRVAFVAGQFHYEQRLRRLMAGNARQWQEDAREWREVAKQQMARVGSLRHALTRATRQRAALWRRLKRVEAKNAMLAQLNEHLVEENEILVRRCEAYEHGVEQPTLTLAWPARDEHGRFRKADSA